MDVDLDVGSLAVALEEVGIEEVSIIWLLVVILGVA